MGKASSNKKVSRAARTGGGRTSRGRTPWTWYGTMSLIVVLGLAGVLQSRQARADKVNAGTRIAPRLASSSHPADHWHVAYGFYICDSFTKNLADDAAKGGIHTHADGLIHVEPIAVEDSGPHATVGRFLTLAGVTVTDKRINSSELGIDKKNGDKCGDKEGEVKVFVDGKLRDGDPNKIKLKDQEKIVFAFVPKDTDSVPEPPSVANLSDPNAGESGGAGATGATASTVPGGTTATTAAPGTTPTSAPATSDTSAPATTTPPTTAPPSTTASSTP